MDRNSCSLGAMADLVRSLTGLVRSARIEIAFAKESMAKVVAWAVVMMAGTILLSLGLGFVFWGAWFLIAVELGSGWSALIVGGGILLLTLLAILISSKFVS